MQEEVIGRSAITPHTPNCVAVLGLVASYFPPRELFAHFAVRSSRRLAHSLCREVAAHGGVGGNVLLAEQGNQIVVVQLHRPAGMIAVLRMNGLDQSW